MTDKQSKILDTIFDACKDFDNYRMKSEKENFLKECDKIVLSQTDSEFSQNYVYRFARYSPEFFEHMLKTVKELNVTAVWALLNEFIFAQNYVVNSMSNIAKMHSLSTEAVLKISRSKKEFKGAESHNIVSICEVYGKLGLVKCGIDDQQYAEIIRSNCVKLNMEVVAKKCDAGANFKMLNQSIFCFGESVELEECEKRNAARILKVGSRSELAHLINNSPGIAELVGVNKPQIPVERKEKLLQKEKDNVLQTSSKILDKLADLCK